MSRHIMGRLATCMALSVPIWLGCAHSHNAIAHVSYCPGGFDYGSGMVATLLNASARERITQAHDLLYREARDAVSPFLRDKAFDPHISIIYDVTETNHVQIEEALRKFMQERPEPQLAFGDFIYWDDAKGEKTTLVLPVFDASYTLPALHDTLVSAVHLETRFAYHAHITLGFLQPGVRLPPELTRKLQALLTATPLQAEAFYVTNRCGAPIDRETLLGVSHSSHGKDELAP